MGAITTSVIAIAAVVLGWITVEIACKPCLDKGREAIDRSLDPNYDPDDVENSIEAPLNPDPVSDPNGDNAKDASSTTSTKVV
ncbi:hypothetical protein ACHQM5_000485 [Ranunculus cassubicifolius]